MYLSRVRNFVGWDQLEWMDGVNWFSLAPILVDKNVFLGGAQYAQVSYVLIVAIECY